MLFTNTLIMTNLNAQTKRTANEANGLPVGTAAPHFTATDAGLNIFSLEEALKNGPVVLIFYRGFWCPYCNKHLAHLQENLKQITEKGASVIAISPEKPEYLDKMASKAGVKFTLLYDEGNKISDAYDVTFTPGAMDLFVYNYILNGKLKRTHSDDSQRLPIPATYIIGTDGTIIWRQFDPDYKKRSSVKDIITNLP